MPSNITEGQGRHGVAEFRHFLRQACGSLMELDTQTMIAERLEYVSPESANQILDRSVEVGRVPNGLINSLNFRETNSDNWLLTTDHAQET